MNKMLYVLFSDNPEQECVAELAEYHTNLDLLIFRGIHVKTKTLFNHLPVDANDFRPATDEDLMVYRLAGLLDKWEK